MRAPAATPVAGDFYVAVSFDYQNLPEARHQDIAIAVLDGNGDIIGSTVSNSFFPMPISGNGCATATVELDSELAAGTYEVRLYAGPNYRLIPNSTLSLTIS